MRQLDVPGVVLEDECAGALKDAGTAAGESRGMAAGRNPFAPGLDTDEPHVLVLDEAVEDPDRVAPAADAGDDDVGETAGLLQNLSPRFTSDHRLKLANHQRIWMRAE